MKSPVEVLGFGVRGSGFEVAFGVPSQGLRRKQRLVGVTARCEDRLRRARGGAEGAGERACWNKVRHTTYD
eukprot:3350663-Rhodomonas_salina.1